MAVKSGALGRDTVRYSRRRIYQYNEDDFIL